MIKYYKVNIKINYNTPYFFKIYFKQSLSLFVYIFHETFTYEI